MYMSDIYREVEDIYDDRGPLECEQDKETGRTRCGPGVHTS